MRFVAGGDAVAELLLAGALRRSCWQGRCGRDADGEALWRCCCWPWLRGGATAERRRRGRVFGAAEWSWKMVIINLLVCWREPVVYHSVYVLLNDGFEEGILFGQ